MRMNIATGHGGFSLRTAIVLGLWTAAALAPSTAWAQPTEPAPTEAPASIAAPAPGTATAPADGEAGGTRGFLRDVGGDYRHFVSWETAEWLGVGGVGALVVHQFDEAVREEAAEPPTAVTTALKGGDVYGNLTFQVPLALGWWLTGHLAKSPRAASAGRDLMRAQISALSWTYALKYAVDRTRPNGDARSFPSGHASATFATAMVLQEHYGWKLGVPVFAAATYTAASRVTVNKHWASDVAFGAVLGMACGRTVTVRLRNTRLAVAPLVVPGGGGVGFTRL